MMESWLSFLFFAFLASSTTGQQCQNGISGVSKQDIVEVDQMVIRGHIEMRYAITQIETTIRNPHNFDGTFNYSMQIPKEAFISRFAMQMGKDVFESKVDTKTQARQTFEKSKEAGAGLVEQQPPTFSGNVQNILFQAKVGAGEIMIFFLKYEQLLERNADGEYEYELYIDSKNQLINVFELNLALNETLPPKNIKLERFDKANTARDNGEDLTADACFECVNNSDDSSESYESESYESEYYEETMEHDRKLIYSTRCYRNEHKYLLRYDVERPIDGNEVQLAGGRFLHYFAADHMQTLPKHIVFVLDKSGSMNGNPFSQLQDAMVEILSDMQDAKIDLLSLVYFDTSIEQWLVGNLQPWSDLKTSNGDVEKAVEFILNHTAGGGTSMKLAFEEAFGILKEAYFYGKSCAMEKMVVFLTDGAPTDATPDEVIQTVNQLNNDAKKWTCASSTVQKATHISVYTLGFGSYVNSTMLQQIANDNGGFYRQIFESGNSFEQIEDFYKSVSDPKLTNVRFHYQVGGQQLRHLTTKLVRTINGKSEYLTIGEYDQALDSQLSSVVIYRKAKKPLRRKRETTIFRPCDGFTASSDRCLPDPRHHNEGHLERLYAFKRINMLLDKDQDECKRALFDGSENCTAEALKQALKYNFVTPLTSLVVESKDSYREQVLVHLTNKTTAAKTTTGNGNGLSGNSAGNPVSGGNLSNETCTLTIYEKTHHRGRFVILNDTESDLASLKFDNKLMSLKTTGDCSWQIFNDANFQGVEQTFEGGKAYPNAEHVRKIMRKASSVKKIEKAKLGFGI